MSDFAASPRLTTQRAAQATKHTRSRTGCLCCRLRKKKCDGLRPTCAACTRNVLICSWPDSSSANQQVLLPIQPLVLAGGRHDDPTVAPYSNYTLSDTSDDYLTDSPAPSNPPQGKGSPYSRSEALTLPSPQPSMSMIRPEHELVFRNYIERTANAMSMLHDAENPFISILTPMAASDSLVLDSLLALSAAHLWRHPQPAVEAEQWMSTHETLAIRGLKYRLTRSVSSDKVDSSLIVTTLILSLVEAMKGDSNVNATLHLKGARALLYQWLSSHQAIEDPNIRAFVIEMYLYLSIAIGTSLGSESHHSLSQDADYLFPYVKAGGRCGPLLGCAHEIFELIPQIHALALTCADQGSDMAVSSDTYRTFQRIHDTLLAWEPPEDARPEFVSGGKVYQQALLVFLHTSMEKFFCEPTNTISIIDQAFEVAVEELEALPFDAPISTVLTWPLAVLGSAAREPEHQDIVRSRLQHLSWNLKWAVFDQVLYVLEALWKDASLPRGMAAFETVMNRLKMCVLIS